MADWFPRFADVKSIEDLSKLIAYPLVISAHVLQTGLVLSVTEMSIIVEVPSEASGMRLYLLALVIFVAKAVYASLCAMFAHMGIAVVEHYTKFPMYTAVSALLMALGSRACKFRTTLVHHAARR